MLINAFVESTEAQQFSETNGQVLLAQLFGDDIFDKGLEDIGVQVFVEGGQILLGLADG